MASPFFVGLDIGSQNIRAAIAEVKRNNQPTLISLLKMPSAGIRKGVIDDVSDATHAIANVLNEIKKINKGAIRNIILGVGSSDVRIQTSHGVVAVSRADDEIYEDDVNRVIQSSQAINMPPNRTVLHAIIKEFIVDGIDNIRDPLGMIGKRLEVNTLIVDAFGPAVKNNTKTIESLGANISASVLSPLAAARAVLSKNQKELGVVLVDIGAHKTGICIYEENRLSHAAVLPIGSANITNDLAIGLRIPIEAAEIIKLSFGSAIAKEVAARDTIELPKIDPRAKGIVSKKFVAEIIESRLAEIFEQVNNEVKRVGKASQLPAGIVLVGGGVKLPNIVDLARQELKLAAQVGIPNLSELSAFSGEISLQAEDPEFAVAIGLLLFENDQMVEPKASPKQGSGFLKKLANYFIP